MITIARSKSPWGPFQSYEGNPILTQRDWNGHKELLQGSGHGDLICDSEGKWWMVHLAFRAVNGKYHHLGRETCLVPVDWNDRGWPVVNKNGTVSTYMHVNTLVDQKKQPTVEYINFDSPLDPEWNYLRNPVEENYLLDTIKGKIRLRGDSISLDKPFGRPTLLARRQKDLQMETTIQLRYNPEAYGEEAGLTAFMNHKNYLSISLINIGPDKKIRFTSRNGYMKNIITEGTYNSDSVQLKIKANKEEYEFLYSSDGKEWKSLGKQEAKYLSSEVAGGFTGVYLGIYATGNGIRTNTEAIFDWFRYETEL